jgi:hypothetical protein
MIFGHEQVEVLLYLRLCAHKDKHVINSIMRVLHGSIFWVIPGNVAPEAKKLCGFDGCRYDK